MTARNNIAASAAWATRGDVEALRRDIAEVRALIERTMLAPEPRVWLSTAEAAAIIGKSEPTVRTACRVRRIGVMVHGKWQVDRASLIAAFPPKADIKGRGGRLNAIKRANFHFSHSRNIS
jgi:hypothetical protein